MRSAFTPRLMTRAGRPSLSGNRDGAFRVAARRCPVLKLYRFLSSALAGCPIFSPAWISVSDRSSYRALALPRRP